MGLLFYVSKTITYSLSDDLCSSAVCQIKPSILYAYIYYEFVEIFILALRSEYIGDDDGLITGLEEFFGLAIRQTKEIYFTTY